MRDIIYAIGDVHGRADLLQSVLDHAKFDARSKGARAAFCFLGDIADKGPSVRQCFELVAEELQQNDASFLIQGNHDAMFLEAIRSGDEAVVMSWLSRGGLQTLDSYLSFDPEEAMNVIELLHADHLDLIEKARSSVALGRYVFAHAGVRPHIRLQAQSKHDLQWIRSAFLDHRDDLDIGIDGAIVVHGHSVVADRPVIADNRISLDTGAFYSGRLSVGIFDGYEAPKFFQTDGCADAIVDIEPLWHGVQDKVYARAA